MGTDFHVLTLFPEESVLPTKFCCSYRCSTLFLVSIQILFWCFISVQEVVISEKLQKSLCPAFQWLHGSKNLLAWPNLCLFTADFEATPSSKENKNMDCLPMRTFAKNSRSETDEKRESTLRCTRNHYFGVIGKENLVALRFKSLSDEASKYTRTKKRSSAMTDDQ